MVSFGVKLNRAGAGTIPTEGTDLKSVATGMSTPKIFFAKPEICLHKFDVFFTVVCFRFK